MRKPLWLLPLALPLVVCSKDETPPTAPPTAGPLFPLTLGSTWVHLYTYYDATGAITDSHSDTTAVISETTIQGQRWATVRSSFGPDTLRWAMKSDGVWVQENGGPAFLLFKYPAARGDVYNIPSTNVDHVEVGGADFTESFPLGLFEHCYEYRIVFTAAGNWDDTYHTFAANIGPVAIASYWRQDPVQLGMKAILVSYTIR